MKYSATLLLAVLGLAAASVLPQQDRVSHLFSRRNTYIPYTNKNYYNTHNINNPFNNNYPYNNNNNNYNPYNNNNNNNYNPYNNNNNNNYYPYNNNKNNNNYYPNNNNNRYNPNHNNNNNYNQGNQQDVERQQFVLQVLSNLAKGNVHRNVASIGRNFNPYQNINRFYNSCHLLGSNTATHKTTNRSWSFCNTLIAMNCYECANRTSPLCKRKNNNFY